MVVVSKKSDANEIVILMMSAVSTQSEVGWKKCERFA